MNTPAWTPYRGAAARACARIARATAVGFAALSVAAVAGATAVDVAATGAAGETAQTQPLNAVWVPHSIRFAYFGITSFYSCDGLRDTVRHVLREAGARPDDLVVRVSCTEAGRGVERMPTVRIEASFPAEATPELLEKLRNDPRRELLARVRGEESASGDALAQFAAERRVVAFDGRGDRRIEDGDCELLAHLVRHVFTPLGLQTAAGSRLSCSLRSVTVGSVNLRLETLQKVPEPDARR